MNKREFWQAVYIAALRSGVARNSVSDVADDALRQQAARHGAFDETAPVNPPVVAPAATTVATDKK